MQARKNKTAKNVKLPIKTTVKQIVLSEKRDKVWTSTPNPNSDMGIDNEKKKQLKS